MASQIVCPHCGKAGSTSNPIESGSSVRCPACKEKFIAPNSQPPRGADVPIEPTSRVGEDPRLIALVCEIEDLKRSHRRFRMLACAGLVLASVIGMVPGLIARASPPLPASSSVTLDPDGTLVVSRLIVKDQTGENRAILGYRDKEYSYLQLYGNGRMGSEFAVGPGLTPRVTFYRGNDEVSSHMQGGANPLILMRDANNEIRFHVGVNENTARMDFGVKGFRSMIQMGTERDTPFMNLFGPSGQMTSVFNQSGEVMVPVRR